MRHLLEEAFNRLENKLHEATVDVYAVPRGRTRSDTAKLDDLIGEHNTLKLRHEASAKRAEEAGKVGLAKLHREAASAHADAREEIRRITSREVKAKDVHSSCPDREGGPRIETTYEQNARNLSNHAHDLSDRLDSGSRLR